MDISNIQNTFIAFSLFDAWSDALQKIIDARKHRDIAAHGSPLLEAADQAFRSYIATVETQNAALIQGLSTYALTPKGSPLLTKSDIAPFLALNLLA